MPRSESRPRSAEPLDEVLRGPIKSKTIFPVLILYLLQQQADHGYGLMQRLDALCGGLIAVNTNKIYPLLRRLETRQFVRATPGDSGRRATRVYAITPEGEARLTRIKSAMLPYLETIGTAIENLKRELYS